MKIFKSIKWRLQIWYGLILVVVLAGFGFTSYQLERNRQFRRVDDELHRRFGVLANALHRPPPRRPDAGEQPFDRPPPGQFPDDGPPDRELRPQKFVLTPQVAALFGTDSADNFYFIIEGREGKQIARSDNVERNFTKHRTGPMPVNAPPKIGGIAVDPVGPWREFRETLPSGEIIRVGCSFAPEQNELRIQAFVLVGVGGIVLLFGLLGGWWFVGRAIRPVSEISSTDRKSTR